MSHSPLLRGCFFFSKFQKPRLMRKEELNGNLRFVNVAKAAPVKASSMVKNIPVQPSTLNSSSFRKLFRRKCPITSRWLRAFWPARVYKFRGVCCNGSRSVNVERTTKQRQREFNFVTLSPFWFL